MTDITVKILQGLREDIQGLRQDVNRQITDLRREMTEQFSATRAETNERFGAVNDSLRAIAAFKERDTLVLANDLESVRRRLAACEERLGIVPG